MRTIETLAEVVTLAQGSRPMYVRYSRGPQVDARNGYRSTNHASGTSEAGLSVANLTHDILPNEAGDIAERIYEYAYMLAQGDKGTRAWLLYGTEVGRGADNEPLIADVEPIGWLADAVIDEAQAIWTERDAQRQEERARKEREARRGINNTIVSWSTTPRVVTGK